MKKYFLSFLTLIVSSISIAQEKGHSHGSGGETEHLYPVLGVFAALIIVGGLFYFMSNRKK